MALGSLLAEIKTLGGSQAHYGKGLEEEEYIRKSWQRGSLVG